MYKEIITSGPSEEELTKSLFNRESVEFKTQEGKTIFGIASAIEYEGGICKYFNIDLRVNPQSVRRINYSTKYRNGSIS